MSTARAAFLLVLPLASPPARGEARNLWEWMNVAPVVAVLEIHDPGGPRPVATVERVLTGSLPTGSVSLDLRGANRQRPAGASALELRGGGRYLALLEPASKGRRRAGEPPRYRLVRGVDGMREIPAEGAQAWISAAERIAAIRALGRDESVWGALGDLLADENPILVRTGLEAHVAFARGGPRLLPSLPPLLSHPSPDIRADAAALAGICLGRAPASTVEGQGREVALLLIAVARRDPEAAVRAAATRALAAVKDDATRRVLREIAETDPEQAVRFEAERILFESGPEGNGRRD